MSNVIGSYIMIASCATSHWVKIGRLGHSHQEVVFKSDLKTVHKLQIAAGLMHVTFSMTDMYLSKTSWVLTVI